MSIVYTELTLTNDVDTCNVELGYIKEHELRSAKNYKRLSTLIHI